MPQLPRIANINCTRIKFEPGDRILVRTVHKLDHEQQKKIRRSICRWAGVEVEVLIVCLAEMDVTIDKRQRQL